MNPSERKYTGVLQFFHCYEHDPEGRTHCTGPASNPYVIEHVDGKHKISLPVAVGHGKKLEREWFRFTERLGDGWDMASGVKVDRLEGQRRALRLVTSQQQRGSYAGRRHPVNSRRLVTPRLTR